MKINKKIFTIMSIGMFVPILNNEAYADLKNEATIIFAEGRYIHKEKGDQSSDCILIKHRDKTIVVDSGADADKFKKFLKVNNVSNIDYLIFTHMHGDHIGGVRNTINTSYIQNYKSLNKATTNNIKIKNVVIQKPIDYQYLIPSDRHTNGGDKYVNIYNELVKSFKAKNINIINPALKENQKIVIDNQTNIIIKNADYFKNNSSRFTPIFKGNKINEKQEEKLMKINSQSLVLEFNHVNDSILLTGDMTTDTEKYLIESNQLKEYDMLKVPHHGCAGSSSFSLLNTTNPTTSVLTARWVVNPNVIARYKTKDIPVYIAADKNNIVVKSKGDNLNDSNIYTQDTSNGALSKVTKSSEVTHDLNNAYVKYKGKNYYYLENKSSENQLVEIDFSTTPGFNKTDKTKPIYPTKGKGYICVKNNEFQYGWQRIKINDEYNYYYFDENTGLAVTNKVVKMKRNTDDSGNIIAPTDSTKEFYYYLGNKGQCLTGFRDVEINGKLNKYYFRKGANPENKGKLNTSKNGKFLETKDNMYWLEADGSLSTKSGLHKVKENGVESIYYLNNGVVQTGFIKINNKDYYFRKGDVNPDNRGKLNTSKNGKFLETRDKTKVYFINPDGSKYTKKTLNFNGKSYIFDSNGVCTNFSK